MDLACRCICRICLFCDHMNILHCLTIYLFQLLKCLCRALPGLLHARCIFHQIIYLIRRLLYHIAHIDNFFCCKLCISCLRRRAVCDFSYCTVKLLHRCGSLGSTIMHMIGSLKKETALFTYLSDYVRNLCPQILQCAAHCPDLIFSGKQLLSRLMIRKIHRRQSVCKFCHSDDWFYDHTGENNTNDQTDHNRSDQRHSSHSVHFCNRCQYFAFIGRNNQHKLLICTDIKCYILDLSFIIINPDTTLYFFPILDILYCLLDYFILYRLSNLATIRMIYHGTVFIYHINIAGLNALNANPIQLLRQSICL